MEERKEGVENDGRDPVGSRTRRRERPAAVLPLGGARLAQEEGEGAGGWLGLRGKGQRASDPGLGRGEITGQ